MTQTYPRRVRRSGPPIPPANPLTPALADSTDAFVCRVQDELDHRELSHWKIYAIDVRHGVFQDIDRYLDRLDEPDAAWQPTSRERPAPSMN